MKKQYTITKPQVIIQTQTYYDQKNKLIHSSINNNGFEWNTIKYDSNNPDTIAITSKSETSGFFQDFLTDSDKLIVSLLDCVVDTITNLTINRDSQDEKCTIELYLLGEKKQRFVNSELTDIDERIRFFIQTRILKVQNGIRGYGKALEGASFEKLAALNNKFYRNMISKSVSDAFQESDHYFNVKKTNIKSSDIILGNRAAGQFFFEIFRKIIKKNEFKLPNVTIQDLMIVDDPNLKNGFGSYSFDDLGIYPTKSTLANGNEGHQNEKESLMNFSHGRSRLRSTFQAPEVCLSNLIISGGSMKVSELLGASDGIYIKKCRDIQIIRDLVKIFPEISYYNSENHLTPIGNLVLVDKLEKVLKCIEFTCNDSLNEISPIIESKSERTPPAATSAPHIKIMDK